MRLNLINDNNLTQSTADSLKSRKTIAQHSPSIQLIIFLINFFYYASNSLQTVFCSDLLYI